MLGMRIVFVCTGNASRSAAAEVVLRKMLAYSGLRGVEVTSCGTGVPAGLEREAVMCRIAEEHGYEMGGEAVAMSAGMFADADLIVVMTSKHAGEIAPLLPEDFRGRVVRFCEYCFGEERDLPDPHWQSEFVYRTCFDAVERGCREMVRRLRLRDRARGSLVGGAVGDALGYAVEFDRLTQIRKRYGKGGIKDYEPDPEGVAVFSDDTQMSLFTAEGLLRGENAGCRVPQEILPYITASYGDWYMTQGGTTKLAAGGWLLGEDRLWARRAPGTTCLGAMRSIADGKMVKNYSKGCGGVMRVAPIGIYSAAHPGVLSAEEAGELAGLAAEITHKHPLSTYSSAALAMIVAECMSREKVDREALRGIVAEVFEKLSSLHPGDKDLEELYDLIVKAIECAASDASDTDCIRSLGEGWVAEETLAIAVFSVMRHIDSFADCMVSAVNHDGDSDSTGAVAGNIIGAIVGYESIPEKYRRGLELHDMLLSVADDLAGESPSEQIERRYR